MPGHLFPLYDLMVGYAIAGRTSTQGKDSTAQLKFSASFVPTVCNALALPENTVYRQRDQLEKLGWIVLIKEGGYDKTEKHQLPDEWWVLEHADFIKQHPGSCPPNPYRVSKHDEGVEVPIVDKDIALRFYLPSFKAIVDVLSSLNPEEQAELIEYCQSLEPDENLMPYEQRRENVRVRDLLKARTSPPLIVDSPSPLPTGDSLSPMDVQTCPLSMSEPVPYGCEDQSPTDRGISSNTPIKTPATTPTTTPPGDAVVEVVCSSSLLQSTNRTSVNPSTTNPIDEETLPARRERQFRELKKYMQEVWAEKNNGETLSGTKEHWKELRTNFEEYGLKVMKVVWDGFAVADELPNGWKFPVTKFNDEFVGYLNKIERTQSEKFNKQRQALWEWRLALIALANHQALQFTEFDVTPDEMALLEKLKTYLRGSRDDAERQVLGLPLHYGDRLAFIGARAEAWVKANKVFIDNRYAEREREELEGS